MNASACVYLGVSLAIGNALSVENPALRYRVRGKLTWKQTLYTSLCIIWYDITDSSVNAFPQTRPFAWLGRMREAN